MKKLIAMLMALAMLLGMTAFAEEAFDYTGEWMLTGAEMEGMRMELETLKTAGIDMNITFFEDGSAVFCVMDDRERVQWSANESGVIIGEGTDVLQIEMQNGVLIFEMDGIKMHLTRAKAEDTIDSETTPAVLTAVPPIFFEGRWLLTTATVMGVEIPVEKLDIYMSLVLSDGLASFSSTNEKGEWVNEQLGYTVEENSTGTVVNVFRMRADSDAYERFINASSDEYSSEFLKAKEMRKIIDETIYNTKSNVYGKIGRTKFVEAVAYLVPKNVKVNTKEFNDAIKRVDRYMKNGADGIVNFYNDLVDTGHIVNGFLDSTISGMAESLGITDSYVRALIEELNLYQTEENKVRISGTGDAAEQVMTLYMLNDGRLIWNQEIDAMVIDYIFTKQVQQ